MPMAVWYHFLIIVTPHNPVLAMSNPFPAAGNLMDPPPQEKILTFYLLHHRSTFSKNTFERSSLDCSLTSMLTCQTTLNDKSIVNGKCSW